MQKLDYTIFGLGDTAYEKFNEMSRYFNKTFQEMGANLVYQVGEGNSENQMTEDQFDEWKSNLWKSLSEHYEKINPNKGETMVKKVEKKEEFPLKLEYGQTKSDGESYDMASRQHISSKIAKIEQVTELRQSTSEGSTLEVIFDLSGTTLTYKTAQNLALFP